MKHTATLDRPAPVLVTLSQRARTLRQQRGLTLRRLADRSGLSLRRFAPRAEQEITPEQGVEGQGEHVQIGCRRAAPAEANEDIEQEDQLLQGEER